MLRRFGRHLFTILAALSLLMASLWVIGILHCVALSLSHDGRHWSVGVGDGVLMGCAGTPHLQPASGWQLNFNEDAPLPVKLAHGTFYVDRLGGWDGWAMAAPLWSLTIVPGIAALICGRFRHRTRAGQCRMCGYDLRAHDAGDRCPECGAVAV